MGHTYRGGKSGCKLVTLFGGYSYDGLNAAKGVQHTEVANLHMTDCCQNLIKHQCAMHIVHTEAHLFSVPNDCLWYDKLWGPSQRVVTLLQYYKRGAPKDIFGYHDGGKVLRINLQSTDKVMVAC